MNLFLLGLSIYALILVGVGLLLSRQVSTSQDFFVAGRKLGPGLLFATLLSANIGAGSTVGAAGLGYKIGLSAWWWVGSAGIGSLILAFTVGPKIRDLAEQHQFLTTGDFLEFRYHRSVRILTAILLWIGTLAILAGQLIAMAWILGVVLGISKVTGCIVGGFIVVTYFTAGGLKGTAWINCIQLLVKGSGFLLALPLAISGAGGWNSIQQRLLDSGLQKTKYLSLVGVGGEEILGYLVLLVPAFIVSPGILQKIYGGKTSGTVRLSVGLNAVVLIIFSFLPVLLGITAASLFPNLENPELALPLVITNLLPTWLGILLLAAIFSAEISSADAILFMLSTSLSRDLYQTIFQPQLEDHLLLRTSRYTAIIAGILGIGVAIMLPSIIVALSFFYGLVSVTFFLPILLGLYTRILQRKNITLILMVSITVLLLTYFITGGDGVGILSPTAFGIMASLGAMWILERSYNRQ